jgi:putative glutamine amidotransferase
MPQRSRPQIGINADFVPAGKHGPASLRLHAGYADAIVAAGGLPVVLPSLPPEADFEPLLDRLDGFVLSGGLDLDPRRLGLATHAAVQPLPERRDESDRILLRLLLDRRLPLLAVGLGMQQLNVALGGSLYLHLPEDLPRGLPHRDKGGGPHRHLVMLEPGSRLEEIYGGSELQVNSNHHQAVRQVGTGLRHSARAPDGVIEAIETTDPEWFCIGVQWHPESETASALDVQLFECFVQACLRPARWRGQNVAARA